MYQAVWIGHFVMIFTHWWTIYPVYSHSLIYSENVFSCDVIFFWLHGSLKKFKFVRWYQSNIVYNCIKKIMAPLHESNTVTLIQGAVYSFIITPDVLSIKHGNTATYLLGSWQLIDYFQCIRIMIPIRIVIKFNRMKPLNSIQFVLSRKVHLKFQGWEGGILIEFQINLPEISGMNSVIRSLVDIVKRQIKVFTKKNNLTIVHYADYSSVKNLRKHKLTRIQYFHPPTFNY